MSYCKSYKIDCPYAMASENAPVPCMGSQAQCDQIRKMESGDYKVFIICTVRAATEEYKTKLEKHVANLETNGARVHLPHRDTNQNTSGLGICTQNMEAIKLADEIHIFYNSASQGTHFDMGMAFAMGKKIFVIENEEYGEGKSFSRMLVEWQSR